MPGEPRQKKMRSLALLQMLKCRAQSVMITQCGILKKAINPVLYYSSQKFRWYSSTNGNFNTTSTNKQIIPWKSNSGKHFGKKTKKKKKKKKFLRSSPS